MVWRGASGTGGRVIEQSTRFVGMDVHKDTIVVAVTATGEVGKGTAMALPKHRRIAADVGQATSASRRWTD